MKTLKIIFDEVEESIAKEKVLKAAQSLTEKENLTAAFDAMFSPPRPHPKCTLSIRIKLTNLYNLIGEYSEKSEDQIQVTLFMESYELTGHISVDNMKQCNELYKKYRSM